MHYSPTAPTNKFIILADGENLVFRYQEMLGAGKKVNPTVKHIKDFFVWHPNVASTQNWSVIRVNYYTSSVGDDDKIARLENEISEVEVQRRGEAHIKICPRVFKKGAKTKKTKIVDLSISIDALRHSYHRHVDAVLLLSGDGDYLPLIKELMRNGTQVWLGAFSSGLNPKLPSSVDRFINLDQWFFLSA